MSIVSGYSSADQTGIADGTVTVVWLHLLIGSVALPAQSSLAVRCRRLVKGVRVEKRSVSGDSVRNSGVHY
jgi:hypothetical protein